MVYCNFVFCLSSNLAPNLPTHPPTHPAPMYTLSATTRMLLEVINENLPSSSNRHCKSTSAAPSSSSSLLPHNLYEFLLSDGAFANDAAIRGRKAAIGGFPVSFFCESISQSAAYLSSLKSVAIHHLDSSEGAEAAPPSCTSRGAPLGVAPAARPTRRTACVPVQGASVAGSCLRQRFLALPSILRTKRGACELV